MLRLHSSSCDPSWLRAAAALAVLAAMAHALTCEHPCNPDRCPSLAPGQCAYGTVMDSCSCCQECGKGPNQTCGGQGNIEGRCGLGLYCKLRTDLPPDIIPDVPGTCALNETAVHVDNATDCENATTSSPTEAGTCREECTPQFCGAVSSNKARICSARGVEYEQIAGRDVCQHTSCHACYLLVRPSCDHVSCPPHANKRCLRLFLNCVGNHYFTSLSQDKLLRLDDARAQTAEGRIICHVPATSSEET